MRSSALAADCRLPSVVRLIARRLGEEIETHPGPLNALLDAAARQPEEFQSQVVAGLGDALTGWRKASEARGLGSAPGEALHVDRPDVCASGSAT